jgi:hypothetical protein
MSNLVQRDNDSHWTVVFTTPSRPEAHIIVGRLESEGISAVIHSEVGRDALGIHIGRFGEIQVLVHESEADKAQNILDFIFVEADEHDTMELTAFDESFIWGENDFEDASGLPSYDDDEANV